MNEFDLIRTYFDWGQHQARSGSVFSAHTLVGDDAAVFSTRPANLKMSWCTDTLVEGVHFVSQTPAWLIGYKALAVNLSDLAAMGATPHGFLLNLSLPKPNLSWVKEFARGLKLCAAEHKVQLLGGDTTRSKTLSISISALGSSASVLLRSSLKAGQHLAVSGELGVAAGCLHDKLFHAANPLTKPSAKVALGQSLLRLSPESACIDVSDGLIQDLTHMVAASNLNKAQADKVGAVLSLETLPGKAAAKQSQSDFLKLQLSGGDDYELLFSYNPNTLDLNTLVQLTGTPVTPIGKVVAAKTSQAVQATLHNQPYDLSQIHGFRHF